MELKKEIISHLIPSIIFFLIALIFFWPQLTIWGILALFAGSIAGTFLIDIDHFIYCFITKPDKPCSQKARAFYNQKNYHQAINTVIASHKEHHQLTFHSAVFIPIWAVFTLFIITSTTSLFAQSLVLASYLHLLKDIWEEELTVPDNLNNWLFWQVKTPVNLITQRYYVFAITIIFLALLTIFLG